MLIFKLKYISMGNNISTEFDLEHYFQDLFQLLQIPSISSEETHTQDMQNIAYAYIDLLKKYGFEKTKIVQTEGHPAVIAHKFIDSSYPTVLIYGHMDVMPVEPIKLWQTDPFKPTILNNKIYCRGADDNKGQTFLSLAALHHVHQKTGTLPCNIKIILEGEEEIGSPNLPQVINDYKEELKSDFILVSDTSMLSDECPSITTGLRGLAYWEIELTGPNRDLHSGIFGGAVRNPINALCHLINTITNENGHITIPGFYDDVRVLSAQEKHLLNSAAFNDSKYKQKLGISDLFGEDGFSTLERTGTRPTFDVCGIWGGHTAEGTKTVIPSKAYAKISTRLVANQNYHNISSLVKKYLTTNVPQGCRIKIKELHGGQPYECPIDHPAYKLASKAVEKVFYSVPVPYKSGGSIPIITEFERILGIKSILMGFGLESNAIHSPNENFPIEMMQKGAETLIHFYSSLSQFKK